MTYNVRNIAIALVLAGIAAFLVIMYTSNVQKQAHNAQQTTSVLVATGDIPAGTSVADMISSGQLTPRHVVQQDVIVGAIVDSKSLDSSYVAKQNLYSGQQVTAAMFSPSKDTGITTQVAHDYRAIAIAINKTQVLGGTLQAGDHVDLVGTYTVHPPSGTDFDVSRIIVRDVLVLRAPGSDAAGQLTGNSGGDKPEVILSVPDTIVPKITFTLHAGEDALWFVLRPGNGSRDGATTLATVKSVIFDGLTDQQIIDATYVPQKGA
jgi:pilus assembly protein CpaB